MLPLDLEQIEHLQFSYLSKEYLPVLAINVLGGSGGLSWEGGYSPWGNSHVKATAI